MVQGYPVGPACQRRWSLPETGRSTPRVLPSPLEIPFRLASLWPPEAHFLLAVHHGPEAQRCWHREVLLVLLPLEVPGHPFLQWGQGVPEVLEIPECQADPGFQALPGAPVLPLLEALALPVSPSVLGVLELLVDQACPVYLADLHLLVLALLGGQASRAVRSYLSLPPAGWGRQCRHHPFLLLVPRGLAPPALPIVLDAPWCPAFQGLQDSQAHPSAPSIHALRPCPAFLAGQSLEAQAPPSLQVGRASVPRGDPHLEAWTRLSMAHKAPPFPLWCLLVQLDLVAPDCQLAPPPRDYPSLLSALLVLEPQLSPEGQVNWSQRSLHLLWSPERAQDTGRPQLRCKMNRAPPSLL